MTDHATRRNAGIDKTLAAIDTAIDGYITWDGDSADAMEWFADQAEIRGVTVVGSYLDEVSEAGFTAQVRDGINGSIVASPAFTVEARPFKPRGWRDWVHRLGLVRSPHCTLLGIPFGFRNRSGIPSPATVQRRQTDD